MGLRDDFAGAPKVIALVKQLKCWDMYQRTADEKGLCYLKMEMEKSLKQALERAKAEGDTERQVVFEEALAEWDEPDFFLWLKAKTSGYFAEDS